MSQKNMILRMLIFEVRLKSSRGRHKFYYLRMVILKSYYKGVVPRNGEATCPPMGH